MNFYLFILGCQYNYNEAKHITHLLEKMGYVYVDNDKDADLIIVLACSVRQKAVDRIYGMVNNWKKLSQNPKIIVSACILEKDKKKLASMVDVVIDSKNIVKWLASSKGLSFREKFTKEQDFNIKQHNVQNFLPKEANSDTSYVTIMQGCDNFCSYCAVPYTRGREISKSEKIIIDEIHREIDSGYKKIILLGQNVNSWNKKFKIKNLKLKIVDQLPFSNLLKKIDQLPYNFTFNFMSSNPHDFSDDLIEALSKLTKWEKVLHLPLQSGDDEILNKMNRKYDSQQYLSLIKNCKLKIVNLSVTTDIIVGFPSETEGQFQNTVKLCKLVGFSKAYISQYSPRPQTLSARTMINDISNEEKKRRWTILNNLINKKGAD